MNKKIIIISVVLLLGFFELFYLIFMRGRSTSNQSHPIQVPQSSIQEQNSSSSRQKNTPGKTSALVVMNPDNSNLLKDAFSDFIDKPSSDLRWGEFYDNHNNPVPLDKFSSAMGIHIEEHVYGLLDRNKYSFFSCGTKGGIKSVGININVKLLRNYKGSLYDDEIKFMKDWEKTLFRDISSVIFPDIDFGREDLGQNTAFRDESYRYADVLLPNNKKSSINYVVLDNPILISNSRECLDIASEELISSD